MTKKLKLKVKIFGDKFRYDVTSVEEGEEVSVYDTRTGHHLDFSWDVVEGFVSENPSLIAKKQVKNVSSNPVL